MGREREKQVEILGRGGGLINFAPLIFPKAGVDNPPECFLSIFYF
jgi:hypothetical protein